MSSKRVRIVLGNMASRVGRKYLAVPFMAVPRIDDNIGNYVTGQHYHQDNKGGLTREELERNVKIPETKRAKFPYIIYARDAEGNDARYPIKNGQFLEIGQDDKGNYLNAQDRALYEFYKFLDEIAPSKKDYIKGSAHIFYIEDAEEEAVEKVNKKLLVHKAMTKVIKNSTISNWETIAGFLNYNIKGYFIEPEKLSRAVLEERLYEACEMYPEEVLKVFDSAYEDHLYVLQILRHGIIQKRDGHFYDGELHVGGSIVDVIDYWKNADGGDKIKAKWDKKIIEAQGKNISKD